MTEQDRQLRLEEFYKEMYRECFVYSERELKKKIKYSRTPMEAKHWNDVLNDKRKLKKGGYL